MVVWFVYILLCDQKTFYVGTAQNVEDRLQEHVRGHSPFTKKFSDFELVYQEKCQSRFIAERRERQLKGWSVAKKEALVKGDITKLKRLSKGREVGELSDREE